MSVFDSFKKENYLNSKFTNQTIKTPKLNKKKLCIDLINNFKFFF